MLQVKNRIAQCDDGKVRSRALKDITCVVVHRIERELGLDAESIAKSFRNQEKYAAGSYTGGQMPYTLVICEDGDVQQALALSDVGPHAKKWNTPGIGIAVIGDFRYDPPKAAQWVHLVELSVELLRWLGVGSAALYGHDELEGGSGDPNKKCPGKNLDMHMLRTEVQKLMAISGADGLRAMGVVL